MNEYFEIIKALENRISSKLIDFKEKNIALKSIQFYYTKINSLEINNFVILQSKLNNF